MRTKHFVLAVVLVAGAVPLPAQSTHPKFKSKEITVASFAVMPPRVYGSSKSNRVEAGDVTSRSQDLATEVAELLEEVLTGLNWEVKEAAFQDEAMKDVQTAYDKLALRLHGKSADVNKGLFSLGEEFSREQASKVADALLFSRVTADFDQTVTGSRTATSISIQFRYTRNVHGRFSLVDTRTGTVLYFFEVKAKGDDEQTRKGLETGITTALQRVASLVVTLPAMAVEPPRPEQAASDESKLATWKGERVTILGTEPLNCAEKGDDRTRLFRRFGDEGTDQLLSLNNYAGRNGTIVDAKVAGYENEIVIELDDGEKIVATDDRGLGFQAELEAAKKLIGTSWWSRDVQTLAHPENLCGDGSTAGEGRVKLRRMQKVTIIGAMFGTHLQKLLLTVETENGQQGVLDGWSGYDFLEERYHLVEHQFGVPTRHYSNRFILRNPR